MSAEPAPTLNGGFPGDGPASPVQRNVDGGRLRVVPWVDPLVDDRGFDPRSAYVERFWLGVLGPSTTLFLRQVAERLEESPGGFDLDLELTARSLGLAPRLSRNAPFGRCLERCVRFGLARFLSGTTLAVRRRVGAVPERHLLRLPEALQASHRRWSEEGAVHQSSPRTSHDTSRRGSPDQIGVRPSAASRSSSSSVRTPNPVPPLVR